jgi:hypothetical protein
VSAALSGPIDAPTPTSPRDSSQNAKERKLRRREATQGGLLGKNMNDKLVHALASTFEALKQRRGEKGCEVI